MTLRVSYHLIGPEPSAKNSNLDRGLSMARKAITNSSYPRLIAWMVAFLAGLLTSLTFATGSLRAIHLMAG
jgi:hypothetical protein